MTAAAGRPRRQVRTLYGKAVVAPECAGTRKKPRRAITTKEHDGSGGARRAHDPEPMENSFDCLYAACHADPPISGTRFRVIANVRGACAALILISGCQRQAARREHSESYQHVGRCDLVPTRQRGAELHVRRVFARYDNRFREQTIASRTLEATPAWLQLLPDLDADEGWCSHPADSLVALWNRYRSASARTPSTSNACDR
jgi:hypothetical protein